MKTSSNSEKFNSSFEIVLTPTVTVQKPPLSPIPVAPAITPAITHRRIHIPIPSDIDPPPFPLTPPRLTKAIAGNSKSFKRREFIHATFCDKPTSSAEQNKIDEASNCANQIDLTTASDLFS